jgi:hypothetical protein
LPGFRVRGKFAFRESSPAFPQGLAAALSSGVCQLDSNPCAIAVNEIHDLLERLDVAVFPEPQIGGPDAAARFDGRAFGQDQAGTPESELAEMDQMPGRCVTTIRSVLAHRGNHDAVFQLQAAQAQGLEQERDRRCHVAFESG